MAETFRCCDASSSCDASWHTSHLTLLQILLIHEMVNRPAVAGCLAAFVRPGLLLPDIAVRDIRSLDWSALRAAGVQGVVFDKDNCLTRPLQMRLVPALRESFAECQRTFGKENVLIVSNSAGASLDPLGIRAADVSTNLGGVPVLLHKYKKPSKHCAAEVVAYFHKQSSANSGSILVVGDRPTTDLALAHRISDRLRRTRGSGAANQPRGVAVFTTGLWASEGRVNAFMRRIEVGVVRALVKRSVTPGGSWRRRGDAEVDTSIAEKLDETSRGMIGPHAAFWQRTAVQAALRHSATSLTGLEKEFAFSGSTMPRSAEGTDAPTVPHLAFVALRQRTPRLARLVQGVGRLRPVAWTLETMQAGLRLLWVGFAHGMMQARIWKPKGTGELPSAIEVEHAAEELKTNRWSTAGGTRMRSNELPFFLSTERRTSSRRGPQAGDGARYLHWSSARRLNDGRGPAPPLPAQQQGSPRQRKVPLRNWIAALAALVLAPGGYLFGAWLHEQKDLKQARDEELAQKEQQRRRAELDRAEREAVERNEPGASTAAERRAQREYEEAKQT